MDTTAPTATPPASGAPTDSPPVTATPDTRSDLQKMQDTAVSIEQKTKDARKPSIVEGEKPAEVAAKPTDAKPAVDEKAKPKDDEGDEPKSIPMTAFKERLAQSARQTEKARTEAAEHRLKAEQASAAVELLHAENERLKAQLKDGRPFDERDEALAYGELERQARQHSEKILAAHKEQLEAQMREIEHDANVSSLRDRFQRDLNAALEQYDHIPRELLVAEMRKENTKTQPRSFVQIAADYDARISERLRQRMPAEKPSAPTTTRSPNGGRPTQYTNDAAGMIAYAESLNVKH